MSGRPSNILQKEGTVIWRGQTAWLERIRKVYDIFGYDLCCLGANQIFITTLDSWFFLSTYYCTFSETKQTLTKHPICHHRWSRSDWNDQTTELDGHRLHSTPYSLSPTSSCCPNQHISAAAHPPSRCDPKCTAKYPPSYHTSHIVTNYRNNALSAALVHLGSCPRRFRWGSCGWWWDSGADDT
jgi:hypothetical protein